MKNSGGFWAGLKKEISEPRFWSEVLKAALKAGVSAVVVVGVQQTMKSKK